MLAITQLLLSTSGLDRMPEKIKAFRFFCLGITVAGLQKTTLNRMSSS